MQITPISTLAGLDDLSSKSAKPVVSSSISADGIPLRLQSVIVLPQVSNVSGSAISSGISFNHTLESAIGAGAIGAIGKAALPLQSALISHLDIRDIGSIGSDGLSKSALSTQASQPVFDFSAINGIESKQIGQLAGGDNKRTAIDFPSQQFDSPSPQFMHSAPLDLSQTQLGTSATTVELSVDRLTLAAMDGAPKIRTIDAKLLQTMNDAFMHVGLASTKGDGLAVGAASLSLGNRVDLMPIDVDFGITVSGTADGGLISVVVRTTAIADQAALALDGAFSIEGARLIADMNFMLSTLGTDLAPLFMYEITDIDSEQTQINLTGTFTLIEDQITPGILVLGG